MERVIYTIGLSRRAAWVYAVHCTKTPSGPVIQTITLTTDEKYARAFVDYDFAAMVAATIGGVIEHWTHAESDFSCVEYDAEMSEDDDTPVGYWID